MAAAAREAQLILRLVDYVTAPEQIMGALWKAERDLATSRDCA
jgi:hypothetical protein